MPHHPTPRFIPLRDLKPATGHSSQVMRTVALYHEIPLFTINGILGVREDSVPDLLAALELHDEKLSQARPLTPRRALREARPA
jgi:hypothetical protein